MISCRIFPRGTADADRDRHHCRDDGRRDRRRLDVALDGVAGRRLAHEHACDCVPHHGRSVLFRPRHQAGNARFSFGTGKIGVLGGFTSAVVLSIVAFLMAGESVHRLFVPLEIHFNEAIGIACVGLLVNLGLRIPARRIVTTNTMAAASSSMTDLNLRAAYLHVLADAFTSVLAITALTGGKFFGWAWLDPVVGIVGSGVVFSWAYTLLRDTSGILLDRTPASSDLPDRNSPSSGERWRFARNRSARLAGRHRKICGDGFDRRARAEELRFLSSVAARPRRTGSRHDRDAALPRRPRVGRAAPKWLRRSGRSSRLMFSLLSVDGSARHCARAQAALRADQFRGRNASWRNTLCDFAREFRCVSMVGSVAGASYRIRAFLLHQQTCSSCLPCLCGQSFRR